MDEVNEGQENGVSLKPIVRSPEDEQRVTLLRCFGHCRVFVASRAALWAQLPQQCQSALSNVAINTNGPAGSSRENGECSATHKPLASARSGIFTGDTEGIASVKDIPMNVAVLALRHAVVSFMHTPLTTLAVQLQENAMRADEAMVGGGLLHSVRVLPKGPSTDGTSPVPGKSQSLERAYSRSTPDRVGQLAFCSWPSRLQLTSDAPGLVKRVLDAQLVFERALCNCIEAEGGQRTALERFECEARHSEVSQLRQRIYTCQLRERVSRALGAAQGAANVDHTMQLETEQLALLRARHESKVKRTMAHAEEELSHLMRLERVDGTLDALHSQVGVVKDILQRSLELTQQQHSDSLSQMLDSRGAARRGEHRGPAAVEDALARVESRLGVIGRFALGLSVTQLGHATHNALLGVLARNAASDGSDAEGNNHFKWLIGLDESRGSGAYAARASSLDADALALPQGPLALEEESCLGVGITHSTPAELTCGADSHTLSRSYLLDPAYFEFNAALSVLHDGPRRRRRGMPTVPLDMPCLLSEKPHNDFTPAVSAAPSVSRVLLRVFQSLLVLNTAAIPEVEGHCTVYVRDEDGHEVETSILLFPAFDLLVHEAQLCVPALCGTAQLAFCEHATVRPSLTCRERIRDHLRRLATRSAGPDPLQQHPPPCRPLGNTAGSSWLADHTMVFEDFVLFLLESERQRQLEGGVRWMSDVALLQSLVREVLEPRWMARLKKDGANGLESIVGDQFSREVSAHAPVCDAPSGLRCPLPSSLLVAYRRRIANSTSAPPISVYLVDLLWNASVWMSITNVDPSALHAKYVENVVEYPYARPSASDTTSRVLLTSQWIADELLRLLAGLGHDNTHRRAARRRVRTTAGGPSSALLTSASDVEADGWSLTCSTLSLSEPWTAAGSEGIVDGSSDQAREISRLAASTDLASRVTGLPHSRPSPRGGAEGGWVPTPRDGSLEACAAWLGQYITVLNRVELMVLLVDVVVLIVRQSVMLVVRQPHASPEATGSAPTDSRTPRHCFSAPGRFCRATQAPSLLPGAEGELPLSAADLPLLLASIWGLQTAHGECTGLSQALMGDRDMRSAPLPFLLFLPSIVVLCFLLGGMPTSISTGATTSVPRAFPPLPQLLATLCGVAIGNSA